MKEIQRQSLAKARREIEACEPKAFARFLAKWQGVEGSNNETIDQTGILTRLSSLWLPAPLWEDSVLPGRIKDYTPSLLDNLIASGQIFWRARGNSASTRAYENFEICFENVIQERVSTDPLFREAGYAISKSLPQEAMIHSQYTLHIFNLLKTEGALFLPQILQKTGLATPVVWEALEELILLGIVTNDSFGPVRYLLESELKDRQGARGVLQQAVMAKMGRWSVLKREEEALMYDGPEIIVHNLLQPLRAGLPRDCRRRKGDLGRTLSYP